MKDRRAIVVLVLFVVLIVGIIFASRSGGQPDFDNQASPSDPAITSTTLSQAPLTKVEFESQVRRINSIENQLFESPDPQRVSEIMTPECKCYSDTQSRLQNLVNKGWKIDGPNVTVDSVAAYDLKADSAEGVVEIKPAGKNTVDKSGKIVEKSPTGQFQPLVYVLKKGQDGVWRLADRHLPEEVF